VTILTKGTASGTFTVGVFQDVAWARRGIDALLADGFAAESLSIVAKPSPEVTELVRATLKTDAEEIQVKALGTLVAVGPLVAALQGEDGALAASGLGSTFTRAGFQTHDGYIYETLTGRGGVLVAVRHEPRAADALAKLHAYGGGNAAIGAWTGRV
jgi:hypothetical protein